MSKAQGWVLAALILTAVINLAANPGGFWTGFTNTLHFGSKEADASSVFVRYWVGAVLVLVFLADAAPVIAGWIAGLILLGAILIKGPAALKLGGK